MRSFVALLTGAGLAMAAGAYAQSAELAERAAAIDQVVTQPGGYRVVVGHISRELIIPVETLRAQQAKTGLSWGSLLIAHRIAREGRVGVEQIVTEFQGGTSWEELARVYKVDAARLTAIMERSQVTVERRSEDRAPPNTSTGPTASPPSGKGLPSFGKQ